MPSASNAILYYEAGQTLIPLSALVDAGDRKTFNASVELWSDKSVYSPVIKPSGVLTGLVVLPSASGLPNEIDVSAGTLHLNGATVSVAAAPNQSCTRGVTNGFMTNSVTISSSGAVTVVHGLEGTAASESRGAAGGPPWIPTGSVELAQIRFTSATAAAVLASEVKAIANVHRELGMFPTWEVAFARVTDGVLGYAGVDFASALMGSHSDDSGATISGKKVYAIAYDPDFSTVPKSSDFKRPANSKSVSSTQIYGGTIGAVSTSLSTGGFKAYLTDGVTDGLLSEEGNKLWFKFFPDRLKTPYVLSQGYLGLVEAYPTGASIEATCTISAEAAGNRVSG